MFLLHIQYWQLMHNTSLHAVKHNHKFQLWLRQNCSAFKVAQTKTQCSIGIATPSVHNFYHRLVHSRRFISSTGIPLLHRSIKCGNSQSRDSSMGILFCRIFLSTTKSLSSWKRSTYLAFCLLSRGCMTEKKLLNDRSFANLNFWRSSEAWFFFL